MKIYHMIIEPKVWQGSEEKQKARRKEYLSRTQGKAPDGWVCVGVCGFHETVSKGDENNDST